MVSGVLVRRDEDSMLTGCVCVVTLIMSDENFAKLVAGKAKAQSMFMGGKLKIKGDMMKSTRLEPILAKTQSKSKL